MSKIIMTIKTNCKIILLATLIMAVGFWMGRMSVGGDENNYGVKEVRQGNMKYISPLLECESQVQTTGPMFKIEDETRKKAEEVSEKYELEDISLYFRDLNNGPWFGIGEQAEFTPASLLKVPLMIAFFKKAETDPDFLNRKFVFKDPYQTAAIANIKPGKSLENGKEYNYRESIEMMIQESDNKAAEFLLGEIDEDILNKVYTDLRVEVPTIENAENFMTVKNYASFFRILYNASYLNKEMSEKALEILAKSRFEDGLRAGVPKEVDVAHKFGERRFENNNQLHDCGVIYYPQNPFILCIMTRGNDFEKMKKAIQDMTGFIYRKFDEKVKEENE